MTLEINQTINQLVIQQTTGDTLEITTQGPQGPAGPSTTFTVAGNSGPSQTIGNGDTLTLTSPVSFQQVVMSAVDTATFSWPNQSGNVFLASPSDGSAGTPAFRAIVFADLDAVLGTMAQQDANAVAITGGTMSAVTITLGTINNTPIGGTTPSTGVFTTLQANTSLTVASDTDANTVLGRIRLNSRVADTAYFSHFDMTSVNNFALRQGATGATTLNTASGSNMLFAVDGTTVTTLSSGGLWIMGSGANTARLNVNAPASTIGAIIRANATGTANIQEWQDSGANILSLVASTGAMTAGYLDSGTNNTQSVLTIRRNSTGTPAANFASRTLWQLESSTTDNRDAAAIDVVWTTATDATRTSRMDFYVTSSGTLTSVMIVRPTGITPSGNITFDLGSTLQRWANVFAANFVTDNGSNHVLLDGGTNGGMIELITSADTNVATRPTLAMSHRSSGTVAAGFGQTLAFQLETTTTNETNASAIETSWVVPTHASRTARVRHLVYDTAEREYMRGEASGSAPMIGFLGANAIVRPTVTGSRGGIAAVASLLTELANLGLIVDNTTA